MGISEEVKDQIMDEEFRDIHMGEMAIFWVVEGKVCAHLCAFSPIYRELLHPFSSPPQDLCRDIWLCSPAMKVILILPGEGLIIGKVGVDGEVRMLEFYRARFPTEIEYDK